MVSRCRQVPALLGPAFC